MRRQSDWIGRCRGCGVYMTRWQKVPDALNGRWVVRERTACDYCRDHYIVREMTA